MVPKHSPVPISRWLTGRAFGTRFEVKQPFARAVLGWVTPKHFLRAQGKTGFQNSLCGRFIFVVTHGDAHTHTPSHVTHLRTCIQHIHARYAI